MCLYYWFPEWLARAGSVILLTAFPLKTSGVFESFIIHDVISTVGAKNHNEKLTSSLCS